jgi:hypothetical protein
MPFCECVSLGVIERRGTGTYRCDLARQSDHVHSWQHGQRSMVLIIRPALYVLCLSRRQSHLFVILVTSPPWNGGNFVSNSPPCPSHEPLPRPLDLLDR